MRVKAIRMGYYDLKRRREGAVFMLLDPSHFSDTWMEALDGAAPAKPQKPVEPQVVEESPADEDEDVI